MDYRDDMLAKLEAVFEAAGARELIETMESDLPNQLGEFARAVQAGDAVSAGRVAHSLKSTVQMVGADALGAALAEVERGFRGGDFAGSVQAMGPLATRCRELFQALRASLDG